MTDPTETASDESRTAKKNGGTTHPIRETESVTEAIVRAVSAESERDPLEIEPLYSVIEADALNTLFAPETSENRRMANKTIAFRYIGYDIRVTDDREVIVEKSETE